ncbi:capping protein inhibiting regulator of actin dynamics isoform X1 [Hemibagrus wyckioides]|uniref:capping protein inhibiting regulator of actin dynamics isoform X1 n=1 Tax=Hemibagrus wyckioides TaxID=337641 RepID=UPI00266CFE1D|nr:capping protein inhibiting regulator of actin dynamics isoform X1 [Hemibagrus wyckioides]
MGDDGALQDTLETGLIHAHHTHRECQGAATGDSKATRGRPNPCSLKFSCSDRRRPGKFQPFRRLFGRKRRRETERGFEEPELKPSHSTSDVCNGVVSGLDESKQHLRELNPLGSRAFSHESIFIPEDSVEQPCPELTMSQENVSDKVRNLQRQIAHNIKFGQRPPSLRKSEGDEGSSDEEEAPRSPLRVLAQVEPEPQDAEAKENVSSAARDVAHYRTPVKSPRSKRPPPPGTIESINLDAVPQSAPRLDNTAAKHKLSVKPKNQRVSRKHRRFTQEYLEVAISAVLQEETDVQKRADETDVWREGHVRSHWTRDDQELPEKSKKQRLHEEEQERLEFQRIQEQEKQRRREEDRRAEELRLEQETIRRKQEECQRREEEKRRQWEEDRRKEEDERRKREEEAQRLREMEERKRREEEERKKREEERQRAEEERRQQEIIAEHFRLEEERRMKELEEQKRKEEEEEAEKLRLWELEEKKQREEEARLYEEQSRRQEEEEAEIKRLADEKKRKEEDKRKRQQEEIRAAEEQSASSDPEWKRKAEELRWREMEERQRPFTFKVSSGEKQILFQKVNLTPVTPVAPQQGEAAAEIREGTAGVPDSPTLSSSLYVPHTAILVTGAQLCGTAVNLDQIKDTACKSLLGLSEDKKAFGTPAGKNKTSPDRKSGKTKSLNESSLSAEQSSAAVLAEWASIRSKIFKGGLDGKYQEYPDRQVQSRTTSEDISETPFSHANLRKTVSASAKFSITPARKKFADSNRNSEVFSQEETEGGQEEVPATDLAPNQHLHSPSSPSKGQNKGGKIVRISDSTEECKFAKDLPSFLVPCLTHGTLKSPSSETGPLSQAVSEDSDTKDYGDHRDQSGDERPSPFGIKLRRTNYSLRFHSEQSTEKRKKRYSAGDSFEGVPVPLTSIDQYSESSVFSEKTSITSPLGESGMKFQGTSGVESRFRPGRSAPSSACSERDKLISKPPIYQKPATFPKPSDGATPPPSPLPKPSRRTSGDMLSPRSGGPEVAASEERIDQKLEPSESVQCPRNGQGDDEPKEKKSFFPSISIPWREKADRRTELIRREKPSLQSRHSLDSSRTQEKETGPLWITLALQKQKGFREQQQSREERKNQREAKLAEKQARDRESAGVVSPTEGKGNGNSGIPKAQTPEENKRPDTLLTRFERRDNLKKANTLPTSVTVEIADSTPSPPAAKDITKRFPPSDTPQVSTEPAWLALAKRKAKAWSDCPQIIK